LVSEKVLLGTSSEEIKPIAFYIVDLPSAEGNLLEGYEDILV